MVAKAGPSLSYPRAKTLQIGVKEHALVYTGNANFPDGGFTVRETENTVRKIQNQFPDVHHQGITVSLARQGNK